MVAAPGESDNIEAAELTLLQLQFMAPAEAFIRRDDFTRAADRAAFKPVVELFVSEEGFVLKRLARESRPLPAGEVVSLGPR